MVRATDYRVALAALAAEGTAPLGPGRLHGRSGIRACVTNYRTTPADIDLVADRLSAAPFHFGRRQCLNEHILKAANQGRHGDD